MSQNPEVQMTLREAVDEVLGLLTGLDLSYQPEYDRFYIITRQLNRALRAMALENEWSWYASTESLGTAVPGTRSLFLPSSLRPRIIGDDAVRLVASNGVPVRWAYFLPRDALHKYNGRVEGLWCSITRSELTFSRDFYESEEGLDVQIPVMREPVMFRLPVQPENDADPLVPVPVSIQNQLVDFAYPDLIILRAAYYYAQTDPVMQPRVQALEEQAKELMYQVIERDTSNTDSPYLNEFFVPVQNGLYGESSVHLHPHSDGRR